MIISTFIYSSETCSGCRRCILEDREFSFEIILGGGGTIVFAAQSEVEQQEWIVALCQAVAEGAGVGTTCHLVNILVIYSSQLWCKYIPMFN